jgi:hypothetical protein
MWRACEAGGGRRAVLARFFLSCLSFLSFLLDWLGLRRWVGVWACKAALLLAVAFSAARLRGCALRARALGPRVTRTA